MLRRIVLKGIGLAGVALAAPSIAGAQDARVLKFVHHADVAMALIDVPYVPLRRFKGLTVHAKNLTGIQVGWPMFWGVKRA